MGCVNCHRGGVFPGIVQFRVCSQSVVAYLLNAYLHSYLTSLFTARRRRARGLRPFYGTAWIAPKFTPQRTHQWHVPPQTNNNNNTYNQDAPAPPAYTAPVEGYFAPSPAPNGQAYNTQYEMQNPYPGENQQQQGGYGQPYASPMSPVQQVNPNYTGQSNNPYFAAQVPPSSPPPAHLNGGHGGKI